MANLTAIKVLKSAAFLLGLWLISVSSLLGSETGILLKLQNYLNEVKTLEAEVTETNQFGKTTKGFLKLKKPGKLRLEFVQDEANYMIIAGQGVLAIIDYKSNSEPLRYPISETPLKYLSDIDIDLQNPNIETSIAFNKGKIYLLIEEVEKNLGLGKILIKFNAEPLVITGWEIPLSETEKTVVDIYNIKINGDLDDNQFFISAELMKFYSKKNQ